MGSNNDYYVWILMNVILTMINIDCYDTDHQTMVVIMMIMFYTSIKQCRMVMIIIMYGL